ncbi:MAG: DUF4340 domain-containing protein [Rudaea sp.]
MNRRNTVILVVVFLVLAGYAYWTQFREQSTGNLAGSTPLPTPVVIFDFNSDSVNGFAVTDVATKENVVVSKQGTDWTMEQPKQGPAESVKVASAIAPLAHLDASRVLTGTTDLSAFGLITGTIEARLTLTNTQQITFKVGDATPDNAGYYFLKGGEQQVYIVATYIVDGLKEFLTSPPYTPTPTFTPLPTLTPTMTPTITPTPGPGTPTVAPAPSPTP